MPHGASFSIRNASDFLREMIIPQHQDFLMGNSSARHALLTIIVVYHMYEWVHQVPFSRKHFAKTYPTASDAGMADYFELARCICNGTKHFRPRANTRVQTGFSSGFSEGFARPLNVELPNGTETSADQFLLSLVNFWKQKMPAPAP